MCARECSDGVAPRVHRAEGGEGVSPDEAATATESTVSVPLSVCARLPERASRLSGGACARECASLKPRERSGPE